MKEELLLQLSNEKRRARIYTILAGQGHRCLQREATQDITMTDNQVDLWSCGCCLVSQK